MDSANYVKHLKVLGKLCYIWDNSDPALTTQQTNISRLMDQTATGEAASLAATLLIGAFMPRLNDAITIGSTLRTAIEDATATYLTNALFTDDLTTDPTAGTAKAVLEAWITDFGLDSKTLTTATTDGLVHFFEAVWSPTGSFPQSGSPTYADGTYVVQAIV